MKSSILISALLEIGLSEFEAKVYEFILKNKEPSVTSVSVKFGVQRLKVYQLLEKFETLGLASKNKDYSRQIEVDPPSRILSLLKQKESRARTISEDLIDVIPQILAQYHSRKRNPYFKIYDTHEQFLDLFEQILVESDGKIKHFGNNEAIVSLMGETYAYEWVKSRVKKEISTQEIIFPSRFIKKMGENNSADLRQTKVLTKIKEIDSSYLIFGSKVALWNTVIPRIVVINDSAIVSLMKLNFDLLWEKLD